MPRLNKMPWSLLSIDFYSVPGYDGIASRRGREGIRMQSKPARAADPQYARIGVTEKLAYGTGDVACNVVFALTTSLLLYFYTNVVHMDVLVVGMILTVSRLFDGASDILIGLLIDRTRSRHGKARAWILWMMVPYGVSAVLLFTVPPASPWVRAVYVFVTYNLCTTVVYTALNLPYATLATLMTRDTDQRASVNLYRTAMSAIGNLIVTSVTFPLVTLLGNTQRAWVTLSLFYAVIAVAMLWFCFSRCRERVTLQTRTEQGGAVPLLRGLRLVVTNRYFLLFFGLSVFLAFYEAVTGSCGAYYAQYVLGDRNLTGLLASFESIPQILVVLLLAPFIFRLGKRNVALIGACVASFGMAAQLLAPDSLSLALFACALRGVGKGCFRGVKYSMLADIIEYGHWKTGVRLQGMMVATTTAGQKFGGGATLALIGLLLDLAGFSGEIVISEQAAAMITGLYIWGNLLSWGLIAVSLLFYRLDRLYPRIMADMAAREQAGS